MHPIDFYMIRLIECYNQLYPFKFNNVWKNASEIAEPKTFIPIFSSCFDWHSSVHGHWLLANLLNRFPNTELAAQITDVFNEQFTVSKTTAIQKLGLIIA